MLTLYGASGASTTLPSTLPRDVAWIDLDTPEPAELEFVQQATGLRMPTFEELSEIERSSRLRSDNGVLYLSMPVVHRAEAESPRAAPVGFVLTPERLVTVRFGPLLAFKSFAEQFGKAPDLHSSAAETFAG